MAAAMRAPRMPDYSLSSFTVVDTIGEGSYGEVLHVKRKSDGHDFALKVMNKQFIIREGKVAAIKAEREILDRLQHPGIVELHFTFQDSESLYMALELCSGDLFSLIKRRGALTAPEARFYCAELALVIEFLHAGDVVHCDVKPENVLLSASGHVKLCDFGCATLVGDAQPPAGPGPQERPNRLRGRGRNVGTAEYMPPEMIADTKVTPAADWWALGCVLFQCLVGRPPFRAATEYLTFEAVLAHELSFEGGAAAEPPPEAARALVEALLEADMGRRLGGSTAGGAAEVKGHAFFQGVDWWVPRGAGRARAQSHVSVCILTA